MSRPGKSKKSRKQRKCNKQHKTGPTNDTPDTQQIPSASTPELSRLNLQEFTEFSTPRNVHTLNAACRLIGLTDSVQMNVMRGCKLRKLGTTSLDATPVVTCGFDITMYGDLAAQDIWVCPPDDRLTEKITELKMLDYPRCLLTPGSAQFERCEALTVHEIHCPAALLYVLRLFKDKPIWDMLRPIRENIIGNSRSGKDWKYGFAHWRAIVQAFNALRNKFNKSVRTVQDFLTVGLDLIKQAAVLMCQTQAFDWMLSEIILRDCLLGRNRLVYRDTYQYTADGDSYYITNEEWLDRIKEDPRGEDDAACALCYLCYKDRDETITTWLFDHDTEEKMLTIWDLQQLASPEHPLVYIGDLVDADAEIPHLPDRREPVEVPSPKGDVQSALTVLGHEH